jgi:hypothetical protein
VEDGATELRVLAVHQNLELEAAMRLLGERPPGTVTQLRRLPADLPKVRDVLHHDPARPWRQPMTSPAIRRARRLRDLDGGKPRTRS